MPGVGTPRAASSRSPTAAASAAEAMPASSAGTTTVSSLAPSRRQRLGVAVRVSRTMPLMYSVATRVTAIAAAMTLA
jgi:hypothetical protein